MKKIIRKNLPAAARHTLKTLIAAWFFGLIWHSAPLAETATWNKPLAYLWLTLFFALPLIPKLRKHSILITTLLTLPLLILHLTLRPSNNREWEPLTSKTPRIELTQTHLIIHQFRDFDYTLESKPIPKWTTRSFELSKLQAMDLFVSYWGSDLASHPIFSFDFGQGNHLAFSIEARREHFEKYSILAGLYRRYELIYIPCAETDAIRLRTNIRSDETVYLYRTIATPTQARARLLEFVESTNQINSQPRFYNTLLSNCTTAVHSQTKTKFPFDWRIILNGKMDELLYERGILETSGLTFTQLKKNNLITPTSKKHPQKEGYSTHIRKDLTGFTK